MHSYNTIFLGVVGRRSIGQTIIITNMNTIPDLKKQYTQSTGLAPAGRQRLLLIPSGDQYFLVVANLAINRDTFRAAPTKVLHIYLF